MNRAKDTALVIAGILAGTVIGGTAMAAGLLANPRHSGSRGPHGESQQSELLSGGPDD